MLNRANLIILALIFGVCTVLGLLLGQERPGRSGFASFVCDIPSTQGRAMVQLRLQHQGIIMVPPEVPVRIRVELRMPPGLSSPEIKFEQKIVNAGGKLASGEDPTDWRMTTPREPGVYRMEMHYRIGKEEGRDDLYICVMEAMEGIMRTFPKTYQYKPISFSKKGSHVRANPNRYQPPPYLFAMDETVANYFVLPGYRLGEFVCRSTPGGAGYVPFAYLDPSILDKLRQLNLELLNQGIIHSKLKILSAYRTPAYNAHPAVQGSDFSRFIYGDALALIIDEDNDGLMDDVNHDGVIDRRDGIELARAVQTLEGSSRVVQGGIGVYENVPLPHVATRGVFLHIDSRGFPTRWGISYDGKKDVQFDWTSAGAK